MFQPSFPLVREPRGCPTDFSPDSWMPAFASMTGIAVDMFPIKGSAL